jgi:hypothetical protein
LINLARLKINGIQPNELKMEDINTSFFDGALSKNELEMLNETEESDVSDGFDEILDDIMSMPLTHWIVISKENKLY